MKIIFLLPHQVVSGTRIPVVFVDVVGRLWVVVGLEVRVGPLDAVVLEEGERKLILCGKINDMNVNFLKGRRNGGYSITNNSGSRNNNCNATFSRSR